MGKKSRTKGATGERELVALAKECGFEESIRTAPMQAGGYAEEFGDVRIPLLYAEAKRYGRTPVTGFLAALLATERPGSTSVLFWRDNGRQWMAGLDAREMLHRHRELLDLRAEVTRLRAETARPATRGCGGSTGKGCGCANALTGAGEAA